MTSAPKSYPALTARIVAAYVRNNPVQVNELPDVIRSVHTTLQRLTHSESDESVDSGKPVPAVPVRRSVHADYIICLEDGKKMKMLKRHLATRYGMTPDEYRAKWGLPKDYPMVAPEYAKARAETARRLGLGRRRQDGDAEYDGELDDLEIEGETEADVDADPELDDEELDDEIEIDEDGEDEDDEDEDGEDEDSEDAADEPFEDEDLDELEDDVTKKPDLTRTADGSGNGGSTGADRRVKDTPYGCN